MLKRLLGVFALSMLLLGLTACGSNNDGDNTAAGDPTSTETPSTTPPGTPSTAPATDGTSTSTGDGACTYPTDGQDPARPVDPPPSTPEFTKPVGVTIETSAGTVKATLNGDSTPCTVNSFVSLAKQGFYDNTPCPRITTDKGFQLLQCGDPSGTTGGGPGYKFADELQGDETYPAGTLAMANAGPDTNGSQFFIVYGDTQLPAAYTVFGTIDPAGLKVIAKIGKAGDDGSNPAGGGAPNKPIDITKVTVDG